MKKLLIILSSLLVLSFLCIGLGYLLPINSWTPFWIILSRSNFQNSSNNLLLGNEHLYLSSPFISHIGTKAWSSEDMVYGLKALEKEGKNNQIYYQSYSDEEIKNNKDLNKVGFYVLRNHLDDNRKPFIVNLAGGGFTSVCTIQESLPASAKYQEYGYTSFCLTYRIGNKFGDDSLIEQAIEDVARSISLIQDKADEFNIDPNKYIITGFSAGAMISSTWCDKELGYQKYNLPKPISSNLMYGYNLNSISKDTYDIPLFSYLCKNDQYFNSEDYDKIINKYTQFNINHKIKIVDCLHGFGLGSNTEAEGWVKESLSFNSLS